jgi:PAS domain S-box-containing protein
MFEDIVETVREPLIALDSDLRVRSANRSFYDLFKVRPEETIGNLIYDLGNRQWDIPGLRTLLEDILPQNNKFDDYEVEHTFSGVGHKIMLLNARRIIHKEIGAQMILLAIEDITDRKRAERLLEANEAKYQELVQNVNSIILKMDTEGKVTFFNKFAQTFFDYTEKEILGSHVVGTIVPETESDGLDLDFMIKDIEANPEKYINNENENMRRNGKRVWVAWTNKSIRDGTGKVTAILSIGNDITERRRMETELKDYEERFRRLFETSKDGLLLIDKQTGDIVNVNPAIVEMLGYSSEEFIGKKPEDIGLLKEIKDFKDTIEELIQSGFINYENVFAETKQGQLISVDIHLVDRARFIQCNVRDITERLRTEASLKQSNADLVELNQDLESFIYSVSHDLRATLRTISAFIKILTKNYAERLDDQGRDYLTRVYTSSEKMNKLIEDLLYLSHISRQEPCRSQFNMSDKASSIIEGLHKVNPGRSVEVIIQKGLAAFADPGLTEVVLSNLLGNAWKFTSKRDNGRIEFGAFGQGSKTVYYIRDNGSGFDPQYATKMFLPFHRLHAGDEFEGTGIGLSIIKRIIRCHGGKVWAEGEVGKGATVYFTLG